jgi:hypothetical protein
MYKMMVVMKRRYVHNTMNKKPVKTIMMNGGHGCKLKFKE